MKRFKRVTFYLVIMCAFWHTLATFIYLSNANHSTPLLTRAVKMYMLPLFQQNWRLFAPEPPMIDYRMYYKVQFENGNWSSWKNPSALLLKKFYTNRFSISGKKYLIQDITIRYLWEDKYKYINDINYPEILTTTWANKNAVKYYKIQSTIDYPNKKIQALRFAIVNIPTNKMSEKNNKKKIDIECLFPLLKVNWDG